MDRIAALLLAFSATSLLSLCPASAITIPTVPVGNVGNSNDLTGFGAVAFAYRIGATEVTVGQYTAFLNAVAAADTHALYSVSMATDLNIAGISRSGPSGSYSYSVIGSANKPVTYVSWGDAARFSNWLHNGQPGLSGPAVPQNSASTEDGAYALNGATTDPALNAISRNAGAQWFIPSEDEWYKAAYHKNDGQTGNYWRYPTSTNSEPVSGQPPGSAAPTNTANVIGYSNGYAVTGSSNYSSTQNYLTDVGAYTSSVSPYGTFDQSGNVFEWNEALSREIWRGFRGGTWDLVAAFTEAVVREEYDPTLEHAHIGFRVASVPEPSTGVLAAIACLCGLAALGRFRRGRIGSP